MTSASLTPASATPTLTRGHLVVEQTPANALLDTSVIISPPRDLGLHASAVAISTISLAELAAGLNVATDPIQRSLRQQRYERILTTYAPVPYTPGAARIYGALCDAVRAVGRSPVPRRFDLLLASVAADLGVPILTRNPDDFVGIHSIVRTISVS